jgi:hypothetical protein
MIHNGSPYLNEEWYRLPSTARIEQAHSYRARSASKKGAWPLPSHPSEAARCASTSVGSFRNLSHLPSQKRGPSILFTARIERPPSI